MHIIPHSIKRSIHCLFVPMALLFLLFCFAKTSIADTDHTQKITSYEGSKTCRVCHENAVDQLTHAIHYRLLGQVQGVYNMFTNKPVVGEWGKGNRY